MKLLLLGLSLSLIVGCGKSDKKWVKDFNYQTVDQSNEKWIVADINLDIGANELPTLKVPLPRDYGYFRSWRLSGENHLGLDINLSTILDLPGGVATLPNGRVVPIDTNGVGVIEVPLDQINGKIYGAVANGTTLLGVAVSIKQIDDLDVGDIGVFPTFNIRGVDVMAGVFTSSTPGQTGIAVFATIGGVWDDIMKLDSEVFTYKSEYVTLTKKKRLARKLRRVLQQKMKLDFAKR